jgi:hypothetical protein
MDRKWLMQQFEKMGGRITIRTGTGFRGGPLRLNIATDRKGEHFTLTIHPELDESKIEIQVLDCDPKIRQMLLLVKCPFMTVENVKIGYRSKMVATFNDKRIITERMLVGHDEMHWFVAGVTASNSIKQAFENLRPAAVTVALQKAGVDDKDAMRRKNKGFVRQGEWFFVPVHFDEEESKAVIHKNEPIQRQGGSPHMVEELVRFGGEVVYVKGNSTITQAEYQKLAKPHNYGYTQRRVGARVFARGKIKHRDHHTIELKGWHEVFMATEAGTSANAFID